jgi:predicted dehydrogenase
MPEKQLRWGILGTGAIAKTFAQALKESRTGKLVAVASRAQNSADAFAQTFGPLRAHGTYDELLQDPSVEAVYISTPHPFHAEWCIRAARAGKHILCEKPLAMNLAEAQTVAQAARENGVFLMEAFMYRCHPQTAKIVEMIRGGVIGQIGVIEAAFSFRSPFRAESRLFKKELGGGGILDVGCYVMSIARLLAGAATGQPFVNPEQLDGYGVLHPEVGTDLYAVASAQFPGGILAQLAAGVGLTQNNGLRVYGTEGSLSVASPFVLPPGGGTIHLTRKESETISVPAKQSLYALEADAAGEAILSGAKECAAMPVEDSLGNMAALDAWRAKIGLVY